MRSAKYCNADCMLFILDILRQPCVIGNLRLDLLACSANDSMITSGEMPKRWWEKKKKSACYPIIFSRYPRWQANSLPRIYKVCNLLSVEALLVAATIIYIKSNNQFNVFENYANANWSIDRYAEWINNHGSDYQSGSGPGNGNITLFILIHSPAVCYYDFRLMHGKVRIIKRGFFTRTFPNYDPTSID